MEAKHDVAKLYKLENLDNFNATRLEQTMANAISKAKKDLQHKLMKLIPIANLEFGPEFFQQIKIHYSNNVDPKTTQDWL
jgi:CRISPR/Cas system CSM-associated protein Csm5 (group 7 of RAMP superfamily)